VLDQKETEVTLAALRNRRAEIERWLDGPAKKATLSALGRVIAELERQKEASAHIRHPPRSRTLQRSALIDQPDER
jgi:hypothetical protein